MKIVTKIIANYLKKVMGKLIGRTQSSFILGRQVVDNVILVQEVVHCIRRKIGKKCWIVAKIDPEKAYDRIKWPFLSEVLRQVGFQELMIKLIMNCTTMTTFQFYGMGRNLRGLHHLGVSGKEIPSSHTSSFCVWRCWDIKFRGRWMVVHRKDLNFKT